MINSFNNINSFSWELTKELARQTLLLTPTAIAVLTGRPEVAAIAQVGFGALTCASRAYILGHDIYRWCAGNTGPANKRPSLSDLTIDVGLTVLEAANLSQFFCQNSKLAFIPGLTYVARGFAAFTQGMKNIRKGARLPRQDLNDKKSTPSQQKSIDTARIAHGVVSSLLGSLSIVGGIMQLTISMVETGSVADDDMQSPIQAFKQTPRTIDSFFNTTLCNEHTPTASFRNYTYRFSNDKNWIPLICQMRNENPDILPAAFHLRDMFGAPVFRDFDDFLEMSHSYEMLPMDLRLATVKEFGNAIKFFEQQAAAHSIQALQLSKLDLSSLSLQNQVNKTVGYIFSKSGGISDRWIVNSWTYTSFAQTKQKPYVAGVSSVEEMCEKLHDAKKQFGRPIDILFLVAHGNPFSISLGRGPSGPSYHPVLTSQTQLPMDCRDNLSPDGAIVGGSCSTGGRNFIQLLTGTPNMGEVLANLFRGRRVSVPAEPIRIFDVKYSLNTDQLIDIRFSSAQSPFVDITKTYQVQTPGKSLIEELPTFAGLDLAKDGVVKTRQNKQKHS
jgi:hypothetical protein